MADKILRCPRCGTLTPIAKGECEGCGLKMVKKKKAPPVPETPKPPEAPSPPQPPEDSGPKLEVTDDRTGIMPKLKFGDDESSEPAAAPPPEVEEEPQQKPTIEGFEGAEDADPKIETDDGGMKSMLMGTAVGEDEVQDDGGSEEETPAADWIMGVQDHDGKEKVGPEEVDETVMPKLSLQESGETYEDDAPSDDAPYDDYGMVEGEEFDSEDQPDLSLDDIPAAGTPGDFQDTSESTLQVDASRLADSKPRKRGPTPSEIVGAYRKRTAKRRYFTRVIPLLIFGIVIWQVGKGYGVSYFVAQGQWTGIIADHDFELNERKAVIEFDIDRKGRRISGSFDLNYPKDEKGKMDKSKTPLIIQEVFTSSRGVVIGEFDMGKARFKLYNSDPDVAMEFSGEIRRDDKQHMFIKDEAFNTKDTCARIEIKRNSLY